MSSAPPSPSPSMAFNFRKDEEEAGKEEAEESPQEEEEEEEEEEDEDEDEDEGEESATDVEPEEGTAEECISESRHRSPLSTDTASSSSAWNFSDDESSLAPGTRPSDLYGKFTWKIENFSQISKRELRSNLFEVGGCKWYILVYPQGCDVCNHLSLFMCVADYDKLLPGWSHFAQFTIAVVNKDPKKSKYSDTLHRFCKKEHDWGWKKFMELSKVLDGFTVAETLVIKAQVQVIRENPHRPFRCLDYQYRRELVRVYMTNVEGICRRFMEEKREKIGKLIEDSVGWTSFRAFWSALEGSVRRRLSREKTDLILKSIVKCFFNQKEVTSPLVIDALYSGYRALDYQSKNRKGKQSKAETKQVQNPIVFVDKDFFVLADDVLLLLERALNESMPFYKDDKGPQNRTKDGCSGDDSGKDNFDRDERRLMELGRRTVEMFVLGHLFSYRIEVAYLEAIALRRQEELIREEEAAEQAEIELKARREIAEKQKRNKKKQAKKRRNDRKEKDKSVEVKHLELKQQGGLARNRATVSSLTTGTSIMGDNGDDDSNVLVNVGGVVGMLRPVTEDSEVDQIIREREASEMEATFSGASSLDFGLNSRTNQNNEGLRDDSSSTCSSDSILSLQDVSNGSGWKKSSTNCGDFSQTSADRGSRVRVRSNKNFKQGETGVDRASQGVSERKDSGANSSRDPEMKATGAALFQQHPPGKKVLVGTLQKHLSYYEVQVGSTGEVKEGDDHQKKVDSDIPRREKNEPRSRKDDGPKYMLGCTTENYVGKSATSPDVLSPTNGTFESQVRMTNTTAINSTETLRSFDVASSVSSASTVDILASQLSNVPGLSVTSSPASVLNQQFLPQEARCGSTITTDLASSSPVDPGSSVNAYKNKHANLMPNSSSVNTKMLSASVECAVKANDLPNANVFFHEDGGDATSTSTCSVEESGLSTKKMLVESPKGELRSDLIIYKNGQSKHQEGSMGFTFGTVTPELLHFEQGQEQVNHDADNVYHFEAQFPAHETRGNFLQGDHIIESPAGKQTVDEHKQISSENVASPSEQHQRSLDQQISNSSLYEDMKRLSNYVAKPSSGEQLPRHITNSSSIEHQRSFLRHATCQSLNEQERPLSQHISNSSSSDEHRRNLSQGITSSLLNPHSSQHITSSSMDEHRRSLSQHMASSSSNEYQVYSSQQDIARHSGTEEASGSGATDEFPHLDIINELLDEDRKLSMKAFLRHDASVYSIIPAYDLHHHNRMYTSQIGMDIDSHGVERGDARGLYHGGGATLPRFSNVLEGDSIQLQYPHAHSPFHHSMNPPCGMVNPIPQHHWQSSRDDVSNGFRTNMDMLIRYPIQTHFPIPDSPYTLRQNGYPLYSPLKHP